MDSIKECSFCKKRNLKVEGIYQGIFDKKVGEKVVIDNTIEMYRCTFCGVVLCKSCCQKQDVFKKKVGIFSTTNWTECPQCGSKMISI